MKNRDSRQEYQNHMHRVLGHINRTLHENLDLRSLQVAMGVGLGSSEAFSRVFKARLSCSPSQWRYLTPSRLDL